MHENNLELFRRHGLPLIQPGMSVLEVGPEVPGGCICKAIVEQASAAYHFACIYNLETGRPGYVGMRGEYEVLSEDFRFDVVFSLSVIEHVRKPWKWVPELARIVKPGGYVVFVNPVSWPYHACPVDCWRVMPEGYKALFEDSGLEHHFSFHGNVVPGIEDHWRDGHGPHVVTDTIAVGRKPLT
jgi:SAM-dependent methyltransferase